MIDLHCHMLPGIDDGANDLDSALEMARIAVDDGITMTVCTPHIYPGLYNNDTLGIKKAVDGLRRYLGEAGIPLEITYGADIQTDPELVQALKRGNRPTIHGTRFFLFEPPHHTVPSRFAESVFDVLTSGYVPVITHPERLTWLDDAHYHWFSDAAIEGAWIQITSGALTGRFGRRARYWSERMIGDGIVHVLATDAHDPVRRPPLLAEGRAAAEHWVGTEEAELLVTGRPQAVLDNRLPEQITRPPGLSSTANDRKANKPKKRWFERRLFGANNTLGKR